VINTVHVAIRWASDEPDIRRDGGPTMFTDPVERLSIRDPRVLLGVQQELARRSGVTQAPDLVSSSATPYFVVSLDDGAGTGSIPITTLLAGLVSPVTIRVCFAADGGWKVVLADINLGVI
jgi:hypothetical protein